VFIDVKQVVMWQCQLNAPCVVIAATANITVLRVVTAAVASSNGPSERTPSTFALVCYKSVYVTHNAVYPTEIICEVILHKI